MQEGVTFIGDVDLYTAFHTYVTEGSYNSILRIPSAKEPDEISWSEIDGVEYDTKRALKFESKEVEINFASKGVNHYKSFINYLHDNPCNDFMFTEIQRTCKLRFVSSGSVKNIGPLVAFTLTFVEDIPSILEGYQYEAPFSDIVKPCGVWLDDVELSRFGIRLLDGLGNSMLTSASIKDRVNISSCDLNGSIYDSHVVQLSQKKDIKLNFVLKAISIEELNNNLKALSYILTSNGGHVLYFDKDSSEIPFVYSSMEIKKSSVKNKIVLLGVLNIKASFFKVEDSNLVGLEDEEWVISLENGKYFLSI